MGTGPQIQSVPDTSPVEDEPLPDLYRVQQPKDDPTLAPMRTLAGTREHS